MEEDDSEVVKETEESWVSIATTALAMTHWTSAIVDLDALRPILDEAGRDVRAPIREVEVMCPVGKW